jgi:hypothetical protein
MRKNDDDRDPAKDVFLRDGMINTSKKSKNTKKEMPPIHPPST